MRSFELSASARDDLRHIFYSGRQRFGKDAALAYVQNIYNECSYICDFPHANRERLELSPPMRACIIQSHIILYREISDTLIQIVRIRHQNEDWLTP